MERLSMTRAIEGQQKEKEKEKQGTQCSNVAM